MDHLDTDTLVAALHGVRVALADFDTPADDGLHTYAWFVEREAAILAELERRLDLPDDLNVTQGVCARH